MVEDAIRQGQEVDKSVRKKEGKGDGNSKCQRINDQIMQGALFKYGQERLSKSMEHHTLRSSTGREIAHETARGFTGIVMDGCRVHDRRRSRQLRLNTGPRQAGNAERKRQT